MLYDSLIIKFFLENHFDDLQDLLNNYTCF